MERKYFIACLVCAVWTIIQTTFHLFFVVYSYYLGICDRKPDDEQSILFYLTYLYNSECGRPKLTQIPVRDFSLSSGFYLFNAVGALQPTHESVNLTEIVNSLLEKIEFFPPYAASASRTSVFMLCFIILDGTWIVSAVSLLMGTCVGLKQSLALIFYGPWLVLTICVALFDATATVLFGFDIQQTLTFHDWLTFVGIDAHNEFPDYDAIYPNLTFSRDPSVTLCAVSARFVAIWLSNWIAFIFVMRATISVYHETYKNEVRNRGRRVVVEAPRPDQDTSAARIRNWQLFYGTVGAASNKSVESEKDLNSNSKEGTPGSSNYYFGYPDVGEGVVEELRGQLPWSYTQSLEGRASAERIELQEVGRHYRFKADLSNSGTEL